MKIGFTGTREGMTLRQRMTFARLVTGLAGGWFNNHTEAFEFHHGCCVGADGQAHHILEEVFGIEFVKIHLHPPSDQSLFLKLNGNTVYPRKPYLERNKDIVRASTLLIATPKERYPALRSGTWSTIRYARKCKVKCYVIDPDGGCMDL